MNSFNSINPISTEVSPFLPPPLSKLNAGSQLFIVRKEPKQLWFIFSVSHPMVTDSSPLDFQIDWITADPEETAWFFLISKRNILIEPDDDSFEHTQSLVKLIDSKVIQLLSHEQFANAMLVVSRDIENKNLQAKDTDAYLKETVSKAFSTTKASVSGQHYRIGEVVTVGSGGDASVKFGQADGDDGISRHHAVLHTTREGKTYVADLNSTNGTYINGKRISGSKDPEHLNWIRLKPTDRVTIGLEGTTTQAYELVFEFISDDS